MMARERRKSASPNSELANDDGQSQLFEIPNWKCDAGLNAITDIDRRNARGLSKRYQPIKLEARNVQVENLSEQFEWHQNPSVSVILLQDLEKLSESKDSARSYQSRLPSPFRNPSLPASVSASTEVRGALNNFMRKSDWVLGRPCRLAGMPK